MDKIVFRGAQVLYAGQFIEADVAVANGRIAGIGRHLEGDVLSVEGYLVPGLIDEHIHGIHGCDTMSGAQDVTQMARCVVQHGVTTFLPTTMNAPVEETHAAVQGVKDAMLAAGPGADIAGVHMEGPFLSEKYKGAQDARANQLPSMENFQRLTDGAQEIVRLMTLAPELPGAEAFIRAAAAQGIRISAGHSDASYETMESALDWGLSQITHLFNGMNPLHHRAPGVPCAALTLEGLNVQMISDGIHLHPAAVKLAVRSGAKILLITDAMEAADMPDGEYSLGGQQVFVQNGEARLAQGNLAGSTLTLERAVRNVMHFAGITLSQAVHMATANVADALGLCDRGRIRTGLRADLCLLDRNLEVAKTMVAGKFEFER